jgi:phosphoglycerate dehydrogenase-like enzyme
MSRACLIVSSAALEFADEISRASEHPIPTTACATVDEALDSYAGQTVLFGDPDMLAIVLPQFKEVEWVQSTWAGITPLIELDRRDYTLTGVKEVFGPQISEYVMGYLLAHELKVLERMHQQRMGNWFTKRSGALHGKRMGIMGTGSIGAYIASVASHFDLEVIGLNRSGSPSARFDSVLPVSQLYEFLDGLDYLVSTLPDSAETDILIDESALAKLPVHAYLVNVGRGNVIDEYALIAALQGGELAGAALDVFEEEPIPQDSPLWDAPNLSITAHIAAISHPSLIVPIFLKNYRLYCENQTLDYVVDFDKGY